MRREFCDRCGDEITGHLVTVIAWVDDMTAGSGGVVGPVGTYVIARDEWRRDGVAELCGSCRGEFLKLVKAQAQQPGAQQ